MHAAMPMTHHALLVMPATTCLTATYHACSLTFSSSVLAILHLCLMLYSCRFHWWAERKRKGEIISSLYHCPRYSTFTPGVILPAHHFTLLLFHAHTFPPVPLLAWEYQKKRGLLSICMLSGCGKMRKKKPHKQVQWKWELRGVEIRTCYITPFNIQWSCLLTNLFLPTVLFLPTTITLVCCQSSSSYQSPTMEWQHPPHWTIDYHQLERSQVWHKICSLWLRMIKLLILFH